MAPGRRLSFLRTKSVFFQKPNIPPLEKFLELEMVLIDPNSPLVLKKLTEPEWLLPSFFHSLTFDALSPHLEVSIHW